MHLFDIHIGFWSDGEGRFCTRSINASCQQGHPEQCTPICLSGVYFKPELFAKAYCLEGYPHMCACKWRCA